MCFMHLNNTITQTQLLRTLQHMSGQTQIKLCQTTLLNLGQTYLAAAAEADGRPPSSKVLHHTAQQLLASPQLPRLQYCWRRQLQVHCGGAAWPPGGARSKQQLAELRASKEAVPAGVQERRRRERQQ
jgi:hypothetical protein